MNHVIILAAGQGQRMNMRKDKLLLPVLGKPLIYYSIMAYNDHPDVDTVTLVVNNSNKKDIELITKTYSFPRVKGLVMGGGTRQQSVGKGLKALEKFAKGDDIIIVHNGVNPLPSTDEISKTIAGAKSKGACISGHFVTSTIKEVGEEHIIKTHDRKQLFAAETPQAARIILLQKAVRNAKEKKLEVTDEAMMLEAIGQRVAIVEAHENNFKITSQADYAKLRSIVGDFPDDFRVGIGQDSHMFEVSKKGLFLGGVSLPNEPKLKANSDGDVILHAIFNAISQAIGENSIGFYADVECEKGIKDSKKYLEPLLKKMEKQGFEINSLGIMVECKNPKIDPLVPKIKKSLKEIFNIPSQRIGITATSGEECTVFGEGLGMQCFAIVSLKKS